MSNCPNPECDAVLSCPCPSCIESRGVDRDMWIEDSNTDEHECPKCGFRADVHIWLDYEWEQFSNTDAYKQMMEE